MHSVGFINLGSLGDRLPRQGSAQESKTTGRKGSPVTDRKVWPKRTAPAHRLLRPTSLTGALALESSHLRTTSPIGRPGLSATSNSDPASPTGVHRNPAHHSSPTSATRADWGHPTGDARSERTRGQTEKARQGAQNKPRYQGHTLYACRNSTLQLP